MKTKMILLSAMLALAAFAARAEVVVIANSGTAVTQADLRDVFTGEKQFVGSTKLIAVDNSAAQGEFLSKALKMDKEKYASVWTKKGFRDGLNPPAVKSGDAEVIDFVKRTPGAVGYVSSSPAGVTVVGKF